MTTAAMVMIDGQAFISLHHHDGRFVRGAGRFALSRRDPDGGRTLFCLEEAQDISRACGPDHHAWAYAVAQGMNEVLAHLSSARAPLAPQDARLEAPPLRFDFQDGGVHALESRAA